MQHTNRTVRSEMVWPILMFLRKEYGFDIETFLRARQLDPALVQNPDTQITASYLSELFDEATLFTGDANLSFKLGEWANPHSMGVLGYLLLHSRSVNESLRKLCRYYPLIGKTLKPVLDETSERFKLAFMLHTGEHFFHLGKYQAEIHLSATLSLINKIASSPVVPEYATFRHPEPSDLSEYRRIFGTKLYFGESENALIFSKEALEIKTLYENPTLLRLFEEEAAKYAGVEVCGGLKEEVSGYILMGAGELDFSLESVARKANLHPRLLQKKLQKEGSGFTQLLSEIRRNLAARYLQEGVEIATVSIYLGYSEPSAFHRAFKRWYGVSPGEWLASQKPSVSHSHRAKP